MEDLGRFKSSRKIGIISLSVLSHHRTYRSVYGGSLIYNAHVSVIVREKDVTSEAEAVNSDRGVEKKAIGDVPITFPCVGPFPCLLSMDAELEKVGQSRPDVFPRLPDDHPEPPAEPFVHPNQQCVHIRQLKVMHPANNILAERFLPSDTTPSVAP